jgi:uncharacterized membrane protein YgdD (TMEM256/DUF423 family)
MTSRTIIATAALLIAAATILGAFGAHALQTKLTPDRLSIYETAVRYHFYHALGLLGIGLAARVYEGALVSWSAGLVLSGVVLFSGSIYFLSFGAPRMIGIITPIGGTLLIAGWIAFAAAVIRSGRLGQG